MRIKVTKLDVVLLGFLGLIALAILWPMGIDHGTVAQKARSKAQFIGYTNALQQFKAMYGDYPTFFNENGPFNLSEGDNSEKFILALSGRGAEGKPVMSFGNRKSALFYSFADDEYLIDEESGQRQIVDAYGNPNIVILIDHDNDGIIMAPVDGKVQEVRATVAVHTLPLQDKEFVTSY